MLDVRRLRVLVEVADRGSFSAAADALCFTQPSISRQVAALEQELGARLLDRDARPVRLTQSGEVLVEHARGLLARLDAAEAQVSALARLDAGRLRVAAFPSANTWLMPTALRRFAAQHPRVELSLAQLPTREHLDALRRGEIDLALLTGWDDVRPEDDDVRVVALLEDPLLVALPPGHRLTDHASLDLVDVEGERWIEGAHPDCLGPLLELARLHGHRLQVAFSCEDWTGKGALVAAGIGVTLYPGLAAVAARKDLVLRPLAAMPTRTVHAARRRRGYAAPATEEMLAVLRLLGAEHPQRLRSLLRAAPDGSDAQAA